MYGIFVRTCNGTGDYRALVLTSQHRSELLFAVPLRALPALKRIVIRPVSQSSAPTRVTRVGAPSSHLPPSQRLSPRDSDVLLESAALSLFLPGVSTLRNCFMIRTFQEGMFPLGTLLIAILTSRSQTTSDGHLYFVGLHVLRPMYVRPSHMYTLSAHVLFTRYTSPSLFVDTCR